MIAPTMINEIYEHLDDELSKKVFENRLLFYFLGEDKFKFGYIEGLFCLSGEQSEFGRARERLISFLNQHTNLVVYGMGTCGRHLSYLYGQDNLIYCDSEEAKMKRWQERGYKVISPEELKESYADSTVLITSWHIDYVNEITASLIKMGFKENQILVYTEILNNVGKELLEIGSAYYQYFDTNIIIPRLSKKEVFVDAGALDAQISIDFANHCGGSYDKIFAFEPNLELIPVCEEKTKAIKDITIYPYGLWNDDVELSFNTSNIDAVGHVVDGPNEDAQNTLKIQAVKLDNVIDKEENVTFIKMDIEGAELNALKGAEQTILRCRPKLAISVYHKQEDIWEIPSYILSLHNDYTFYLRVYSFYGTEIVLYAV